MKKKLVIGAAAGCATAAGIAAARKKETGPKQTIWDKMREGMEEMPEDFPPRIMFDDVEATKANTGKSWRCSRKRASRARAPRRSRRTELSPAVEYGVGPTPLTLIAPGRDDSGR